MKGQQGGNEYLGLKVGFGFLTSPCSGEDVLGVRQFAHSDVHGACDVKRGDLCCLLRLNEVRCGSHPRILTAQQTSGLDLILGDKRICLKQKKRCWGGRRLEESGACQVLKALSAWGWARRAGG